MAEEYERRGALGEDGPGEGGEVRERGLFGGHHGRRSEYINEADVYGSELGRRPGLPYEPVYERPGAMAYGEPGYGRPGAMAYEGEPGYGRPGAMAYGEPGYGRPGAMAYGEPGYGRPGAMAYGEPGYGRPGAMAYEGEPGYGRPYGEPGYGGRRPEVVYVEGDGYGRPELYDAPVGEASDLGTGLIDSNIRSRPDYGSSLTRPDIAGVPIEAYERRGHHDSYSEFEEERRHKRYGEVAAAAALGYGLHERHERRDAEERLEELGYDSEGRPLRRKHHGLFRSDS